MKKSYFTSKYKSKNDLITTLRFIKWLKHELANELILKFNLLDVEVPHLSRFKSDFASRIINFDNKKTEEIFQFIIDPSEYLNKLYLKLNKNHNQVIGLLSQYTQYNRDIDLTNVTYLYKDILDIRLDIKQLPSKKLDDIINNLYENFIDALSTILKKCNEVFGITFNQELLTTNYKISSLTTFFKFYQTLKIDDYIQQTILSSRFLWFKNLAMIKSTYLTITSEYDDLNNTAQLFWYHEPANEVINLMQISTGMVDDFQYAHWTIALDQLIMVLLDKAHIQEIIPGAKSEDLIKEASKKGVNIL